MQVKPNTKTAFQSEATPCPTTGECAARKKAYLVAGDAVFASAEKSGFRCAYYGDAKGNLVAGFLRSQDLAEFKEDRVPLTQDFLKGKWKNEDNDLTFAERKPGFMHLTGHAQWSNGETTHEGEVNAEGKINGNQTFFREGLDEETDCTIRVIRRGPYLILGDNSLCGGVNVRFSGIYVKVHR
jgi:hypothetical protein